MKVSRAVPVVLGLWALAILALGSAGAFVRPPDAPPIPIGLGATLPVAAFLLAYRLVPAFRDFVLGADLRLFAAMQAWRAGGLGFLALYANGVLPGLFAWPAGVGDMIVGATAPWMVMALMRDPGYAKSRAFALWNLFGILDLVVAVALGAVGAGLFPALTGGVTTAPMAHMPLVFIPAFLVPFFVILHLAALFQWRNHAERHSGFAAAPREAAAA